MIICIMGNTPGDDEIKALGGDDTFIGTTGNDLINGGNGYDTVDYSNLGQPITLLPRGVIGEGTGSGGQISNIEKIIGAKGQKNTIDGSSGTGGASFDINLEANQLVVNNIPGLASIKFGVENFVNVTVTPNQDSIIGNSSNNVFNGLGGDDFLSGGLGNDTLLGGDGNDTLQGSTNVGNARSPEKDTLTAGAGIDKFILGDASGCFYTKLGLTH
jgi:Ca2+-binding RTX toxin-like protein